MKLLVSVERRYSEFNGEYYVSGVENDEFFERYLDSFSKVFVIARVEKINHLPKGVKVFKHRNIDIVPIYTKKSGILNFFSIIRDVKKLDFDVALIRTPGILSYLTSICLIILRVKFSLEVVTNPKQESSAVTSNLYVNKIFSLVLPMFFRLQILLCKSASFVTEREIQNEYLTCKNRDKFNHHYSSINIGSEFYWPPTKRDISTVNKTKISLLFVGVLDRDFKGLDVFLKILANLPERYIGEVVGDGKLLKYYIKFANDIGLMNRVTFHGYVSDVEDKLKLYRECDLFVLSSRREGLPRVVIEAMANSLPCVCSDVSGVRELVSKDCIYPINDVDKAVDIILSFDSMTLKSHSVLNYQNSQKYHSDKLAVKRKKFYEEIKGI